MQILIKTLTGRKRQFNVEPTQTILQLKQSLQEKEGIAVEQIRLIYSGRQLADSNTLESYGVKPGGTLHMVLALRGGF